MRLTEITLANFRNYAEEQFLPEAGLNVITGDNGQGKTALLEAVYVLATTKSFRTTKDQELVRFNEPYFRLKAHVDKVKNLPVTCEIAFSEKQGKQVRVDKIRQSRVSDIVGNMNAVVFSASDIDMVKGDPTARRRFLNYEIAQTSPRYMYALGASRKVLEQRNNLLKSMQYGRTHGQGLEIWDQQLVRYGAEIVFQRRKFTGFLQRHAAQAYLGLADEKEELLLKYRCNVAEEDRDGNEAIETEYRERLVKKRDMDIERGTTSVGPHRDDLIILVDGKPAREFASQGQQRTAAISLKIAEIGLMEEITGEAPVLLLDDVVAELDEKRRTKVFKMATSSCQTLATATMLEDIPEMVRNNCAKYRVTSGRIERQ